MKKSPIHIRVLFVFFAVFLIAAQSQLIAQSETSGKDLVTINSRPSGAVVHLDGEYQFIGRTPFVVPYTVIGKYEVKASKPGYQPVRRVITFAGDASQELKLQLQLKTRLKATGRSLLAPGWGQFYSERKMIGSIYSSSAAISLIYLIKTQQDYLTSSRDYESLLTTSNVGGLSYEQQRAVIEKVENAWKSVESKSDTRDLNLYIIAGIWAINMLDSYLFFPNYGREIDVFQRFSLNSMPIQDGAGIGLNYSFN